MLEHSIAKCLSIVSSALVVQRETHSCSELSCVSWTVGKMVQGGMMIGTVVSQVLVSWCPVVAEVFLGVAASEPP